MKHCRVRREEQLIFELRETLECRHDINFYLNYFNLFSKKINDNDFLNTFSDDKRTYGNVRFVFLVIHHSNAVKKGAYK